MNCPDARTWFTLDNGDRACVEVFEFGAIGCSWHSDTAKETPRVDVRREEDTHVITFTHSTGNTFCLEVARDNTVWAAACENFLLT